MIRNKKSTEENRSCQFLQGSSNAELSRRRDRSRMIISRLNLRPVYWLMSAREINKCLRVASCGAAISASPLHVFEPQHAEVHGYTTTYYRRNSDNSLNAPPIVWIHLSQESVNPRSLKMYRERNILTRCRSFRDLLRQRTDCIFFTNSLQIVLLS